MRRVFCIVVLPCMLFALERVNLIKDAGFEKDSEVWQTYTGRNDGRPADSVIANRHDPEKAFNGNYAGSCDNRAGDYLSIYYDSAVVIQGFCCQKKVSDLDSLSLFYSLAPFMSYGILQGGWIAVYVDAGQNPYWIAGYVLLREGQTPSLPPPMKVLRWFYFPNDTSWHPLAMDIYDDLIAGDILPNSTLDSFLVMGWGATTPGRRGQKIYWDDIRLTGYADYDVGVKEILSGDSVWAGTFYKSIARIKNFGRQPADDFLAIAEIRQGESLVWADTIPHTLPADTEDTLTFDSFHIPSALNYTLTIRTVMDPDESDEDDELSKTLYGTGIAEQPEPQAVNLEVQSFTASLRASYFLPYGESGTITLYDATGRRIERMTIRGSGETSFSTALASGVYFVRLEAGQTALTKKAVLVR